MAIVNGFYAFFESTVSISLTVIESLKCKYISISYLPGEGICGNNDILIYKLNR